MLAGSVSVVPGTGTLDLLPVAGKPRVEHKHRVHILGPFQCVEQSGVIVQPQTLRQYDSQSTQGAGQGVKEALRTHLPEQKQRVHYRDAFQL